MNGEWEMVIAMRDGESWTDPAAIRGVLGAWSQQEAKEKLAAFKKAHPGVSVGIRPRGAPVSA